MGFQDKMVYPHTKKVKLKTIQGEIRDNINIKKIIKTATVKQAVSHSCHTIRLHQGVLLPVGVSGPDEESGSHELQGS